MQHHTEHESCQDDPNLPAYSADDDDSLAAALALLPDGDVPILHAPKWPRFYDRAPDDPPYEEELERYELKRSIIKSFFEAIENGQDDAVERFISRGLVSPDTTSCDDETPLLAAVRSRRGGMVRRLIALGSIVDGYGHPKPEPSHSRTRLPPPERTPLQYAAETGSLAIVKILMEDFQADDALIAPDGYLALRLAARNGHREIVQYLPARRGGSWLRWRTAHAKEMAIARRAVCDIAKFFAFFVWEVPKFLVWTVPKHLGKSLRRRLRSAWNKRHEFGEFVKRQFTEFPRRLRSFAKSIHKAIVKIPDLCKRLGRRIAKAILAIPKVTKMASKWVLDKLQAMATWVVEVFTRFASVLHTAIVATLGWFSKITFRDVWNGLCAALRVTFIGFPVMVWSALKSVGDVTYDMLKVALGGIGICLWYVVAGIWWVICFVPRKMGQAYLAMVRLMGRGVDEVLVYFNPKRV